MSDTAPASLPLLCALGGHRAVPSVRWNQGFYFSRCRRCRRDLIRTAYGGWHVPKGARVVWSAQRPETCIPPSLAADYAAAANGTEARTANTGGLPIEDVLRHLHDEGRAPDGESSPRPGGARTYIPDFMEDEATDTSWRTNRPTRRQGPGRAEPVVVAHHRSPRDPDTLSVPDRTNAGHATGRRIALAMAATATLFLLVFLVAGRGTPALAREALVTADIIACRGAPSESAPPVTQLLRGDRVRILAREGEWAGVDYRTVRCWAPADRMAVAVPL